MAEKKPTKQEQSVIDALDAMREIVRIARKSIVTRKGNALIAEYEKKYLKKPK